MIAVIGAAGKTGRAVMKGLASRHARVRPLVRRLSGLDGEVVVDLMELSSLKVGLRGVGVLYHMAPNMHLAEVAIGRRVIRAALHEGVQRIVYHSVLHPQVKAMPHHWDKLRVEQAVIECGLDWTILQPAPYVQNFRRPQGGILQIAYRADATFSFVDLSDIGEAAAKVLTSEGFTSGIYELAGPAKLTVAQIAEQLGAQVETVDVTTWARRAIEGGMPVATAARFAAMFRHYDAHGLVGNPAALAMLLGRPPTDALAALLRDVNSDRKSAG